MAEDETLLHERRRIELAIADVEAEPKPEDRERRLEQLLNQLASVNEALAAQRAVVVHR